MIERSAGISDIHGEGGQMKKKANREREHASLWCMCDLPEVGKAPLLCRPGIS